MLKIEKLSKHYGDKTILNNLSLELQKGTIGIFLGGSGVGKSTLLRILCNLETSTTGTVELNGTKLKTGEIHSHDHRVGMVFQQFHLFSNMNVLQNITFPLEKVLHLCPKEAQTIAYKLLENYGLADKAQLPTSQLSGGQQQRLAIARTLALKPKVICLDEPTSALDPLLSAAVATTINELAQQGYFVLVATHDISLVRNLQGTIYLMQQGTFVNVVSTKEFWNNPNAYPELQRFIANN